MSTDNICFHGKLMKIIIQIIIIKYPPYLFFFPIRETVKVGI